MVLHLRKLISILITLIMMMSVVPVFAEEVPAEENTEPVQAADAVEMAPDAERIAVSDANRNSDDCVKDCAEKGTDRAYEENKACQVEVSLYDAEGNILVDKEKVQIHEGITMQEMLLEFNSDRNYDIDWKECSYTVNGTEEGSIDLKTFVIKDGDSVEINTVDIEEATLKSDLNPAGELQIVAVAPETVVKAYSSTESKIVKLASDSGWGFGNEWKVIGLSRSEKMTEADVISYCNRIAAYVESKKTDRLSERLSTDNSRLVISLTSLGYDPTDVNGYNLLQPLADMNYITKQGLSGPVWALIAFDSHKYEIPKAGANQRQTTREDLVNMLLSSQLQNKGWAMSGTNPDVDMTCMVLQALTPYCNDDNPAVKKAVNNALDWLSSIQNSDGSFCTDKEVSSESQSQVIVALTGLGIDPEKDERFVKGNNSALDALMSFYVYGGGFKHISSNWKLNELASQQGYYALAAYYRFKDGKSSLYCMRDIILKKFSGVAQKGDKGSDTKKIDTAGKAMGKTRSLGYLALGNSEEVDKSLIKENFSDGQEKQSALAREKAYNEYIKSLKLAGTLPWIYMCIGALALMGLVLMLRNRKPE